MPHYLHSETEPPFPHTIRCVPDTGMEHAEGVDWLHDLYRVVEMLGMVEGRDYITRSLTTFGFETIGEAERFCLAVNMGLGANLSLREFD